MPTILHLPDRCRWGCQPYAPATLYIPERISDIHFCKRLNQTQDHNAAGRVRPDWFNTSLSHLSNSMQRTGVQSAALNRTDYYSLTLYSLQQIVSPYRHRGNSSIRIAAAASLYTRAVMHGASHVSHVITHIVKCMDGDKFSKGGGDIDACIREEPTFVLRHLYIYD
jgi:hypothetical protein